MGKIRQKVKNRIVEFIKKIRHGIHWRVARVLHNIRKKEASFYKYLTLKVIYPFTYQWQIKRHPLDEKKVVFLEVRMLELTDSFQLLYQALTKKEEYHISVQAIGAGLVSRRMQQKNSLEALKEIASAKYVFIDDSSSLISCIKPRPQTKIIQTWHACGAFKKFGHSTVEKIFGGTNEELRKYPIHKNFSVVTVSSPEVIWAYAQAFHMEDRKEAIMPIGISRTDIFYDQDAVEAAYEKIHQLMPASREKKIILYAPTFRGRVRSAHSPNEMDLGRMQEALGEQYVLVCKHHPFVKQRPQIPEELSDFAVDFTEEMSIEELLMVSDICISDYSSLVFEYSLFERPMIFFAYDLENYYDWRGFYYDYEEMTPGPICRTTEKMIEYIRTIEHSFDRQRVIDFKNKFMSACDGHATERILELLE